MNIFWQMGSLSRDYNENETSKQMIETEKTTTKKKMQTHTKNKRTQEGIRKLRVNAVFLYAILLIQPDSHNVQLKM